MHDISSELIVNPWTTDAETRVLRLAVFSDDALLNHLSDMHPEDPLSATHSYVTAGVAAVSLFSNRI